MEKHSKLTSAIWNLFNLIDNTFAQCTICRKKLSYKSSISNLKRHVQLKHPTVSIGNAKLKQAEAPRQQTDKNKTPASVAVPPLILHAENNKPACAEPMDITKNEEESGTKETTTNYQTSTQQISRFLKKRSTHSENQEITEKLLNMFIEHFQPFSLVEEKSFVNFVEALNPSYQIPSRLTISQKLIPAKYEATLNSIKEIIPEVRKLCLTTDNWTSANNDSFLAVTAHYISQDFIFKSAMLQCAHMTGSHTSSNLASELQKIITEWGLNSKITMVISDNAASIKKAISEELHLKHFGCFAHTINLVVNDGLSGVMPLIDKIKTIVTFFKSSSTGWENLQFQQTRIHPDMAPKKLIQSVPTRWNSIYYMLERFNELDEAIKSTLALIKHSLPLLSSDDWEVIHELLEVLKPFEEVTKAISSQNYPTASLVIVYFNGLNDVCTKLKKKAFHRIVTTVVEKLITSLRERLGTVEHNRILSMCTFLDPRYKYHAFVNDSAAEHAKNEIINAACSHLLPTEIRDNSVNKEIVKYTENEFSVWNFLSKTVLSSAPQGKVTSQALLEVQRYMEENIVPFSADPIEWWQSNRFKYPHLSLVVQNYFCCLATSVPCERLFSKAGALLHERRTRLSRRLTQKLVYLNSNQNYIPT